MIGNGDHMFDATENHIAKVDSISAEHRFEQLQDGRHWEWILKTIV